MISVQRDHRPPLVVLDTNVALALFAYADPSCSALAAALHEHRLQAVANTATRAEWLRVLWRESLPLEQAIRSRAAGLFDAVNIEATAEASATESQGVLPRCRDPDDQIFLELARGARCVVLFSRDRELLKLTRRTRRDHGFAVARPEEYPLAQDLP
jgi:predicted nucleic acid-binding protein